MALFGYKRTDAAACLTAAVLCAVERQEYIFLCYVGRLLSERNGQTLTQTLKTLFAKRNESSFALICWLYAEIERLGITAPDLYVLLGRFDAVFDDGMLQLSAPRGDHPAYLFLG